MPEDKEISQNGAARYFTVSELAKDLKIPLVLTYKLIKWGLIIPILAADGTIQITGAELAKAREFVKSPWKRTKLYWKSLGPGLITGASDDDPSGIATYSAVGAKFGLGLLWMSLWLLPMMMAVQEACARIGIVTNKGLASVLKRHYKKYFVFIIVILLVIANTANIGADIGAMASSLQLVVPINFTLAAICFALFIILLEIFVSYKTYSGILKWMSLVLFVYIITFFILHPNLSSILKDIVRPQLKFEKEFIFAMIAFFGTTITPYLFFWQTSEEAEEVKDGEKRTSVKMHHQIVRMRSDVKSGMIFSNLITIFIIFTAAEALFKNGIFEIGTAEQAAMALKPLAGDRAFLLFALGIIGMGIMAVPILAGASAYALAEVMNWEEGLSKKFSQARAFYSVIIAGVLIGLLINFSGINPMQALYYSAWLNGAIAFPLLIIIMVVANSKKIMGSDTSPFWVRFFGWAAAVAMGAGLIATAMLSIK